MSRTRNTYNNVQSLNQYNDIAIDYLIDCLDNNNIELGIIEGQKKRVLERYIDKREFRQRKSYDEYYIDLLRTKLDLDLNDLFILAEEFRVAVNNNSVTLRHLD